MFGRKRLVNYSTFKIEISDAITNHQLQYLDLKKTNRSKGKP